MKKGFALLCAASLLAACSSEPSDADIKAAVEVQFKEIEASQAQLKAMGLDVSIKLVSLKKIGCSKDKEGAAYICDVQATTEIKNPLTGKLESKEATDKLRLVKGDKAWSITK